MFFVWLPARTVEPAPIRSGQTESYPILISHPRLMGCQWQSQTTQACLLMCRHCQSSTTTLQWQLLLHIAKTSAKMYEKANKRDNLTFYIILPIRNIVLDVCLSLDKHVCIAGGCWLKTRFHLLNWIY